MTGLRKVYLGTLYMLGVFSLAWKPGMDMIGLAALATGAATGLGVIIWGNAQEWRAKGDSGATKA